MSKNKNGLKKIYLRIFPKTFLSMSLILGVLIIIVHSLVYVLMNQAYADEKKEKAKRNLNELSEQITGKSSEEIRRICGEFALQRNVNLNLKIDGKVQHLQGFSGADIVTDELLPSDLVPLVNNEQLGSILVSDLTTVDADGKTILVQMLSNVESLKEARESTLKILPFSFLCSIVVALIFSYFYSRLIVGPIKKIAITTEKMREMKEVECEITTEETAENEDWFFGGRD